MITALFSAIVIIFVFSILIVVHELGHFLTARAAGIRVERFALGFGKKLMSVVKGGTEYRINLIPFGGYIKMAGEDVSEKTGAKDEFWSKPVGNRFWVLVSGSLFNYIFGFMLMVLLYTVGMPKPTSEVGGVLKGSPADRAGIKSGDVILSMNGKEVFYWQEVLKTISENKSAQEMSVKVKRGEEEIVYNVVPSDVIGEKTLKQKILGIMASKSVKIEKAPLVKAVILGGTDVYYFTVGTYKGIWMLVTGQMPVKGNIGGPIQIIDILAGAVSRGMVSVIYVMAIISLGLALFNLLPFPVLDGGHIVFLAIEKLRGRPVSEKTYQAVSQVALVLLIMFVVYVSYFDTVRVITGFKR